MSISSSGKATDLLQFTRDSNATVTDSDGKVKWAPHNLLTNSESFDAAAWAKTTLTVAANADVAPNSTTTADTLTAGGANSTILQTFTAEAVAYTYGVWLRRKTGTGTIQIAADSGTWNTVTITSSWALYTISQTPTAGSKTAGIRIVTSADEVYAWGAHLYRSDLGGMQANTSAYPMYNPTTPKNLLGYTEDFSNWAKTVAGDTITLNAATAPNGLQTADLWVADGTSANHRLDQTVSVQPTTGTYSFYAKLQTASAFIQLSQSGNNAGWVNFDLVNGTKSDQGTGITGSITSVGNGWYRCSAYNTNSPSANLRLSLVTGLTAARIETAAISSGIYLWGAQLSDSASLDPYVANHFAAPSAAAYYGPRRDFDPVTLACKGLLVEEQRTNSLLHSAAFDNATWTNAAPDTPTVTANNLVAPDGTTTGDLLTAATGGIASQVRQSITATGALAYTFSVFIKQGTSTQSRILIRDNTNGTNFIQSTAITWSSGVPVIGGTTGTWATPVSVGNGWWRIAGTGTAGAGASVNVLVSVYPDNSAGTGTLGVWGAQLEAGSFATSYIPTTTASATRSADVAQVSTAAFPYSATEGTLVVAWELGQLSGSPAAVHLTDAAESNRIRINAHLSGINRSTITAAGSLVANIDTSTAATGITKYALGVKSADYAVYRNGSAGGISTNAGFPSGCTELRIGRDGATGNFNGHIRQITYLPRRISNTELQTRTS